MTQLITQRDYTTWQLVKLYWQSEERFRAYLFVVVIMLMTMALVGFDVVLSYWSNYFYNALQAYHKREAIYLLFLFFGLVACYIVLAVYRYYISQLFGLRWRKWLTEQFITRWLAQRDYYYLETFDEKTDNPDQRIQEDIGALVAYSINLSIGLMSAITTFISFIYVLWELSGEIVIPMGSWGTLHIPGYLVWVSLVYAMIGTYITFKIGYPLVGLNFEQQRREATFRFAAIDLRSHAEHVALYRGENHQKNILQRLFNGVLENWYSIILRQKLLLWFTAGYNQVTVVLPLIVALPNYFSKVFMLGGLMQSLRAFTQIQDASSFFVNAYTQIAEWRAVTRRLITFLNHMHEIAAKVTQQNQLVIHKQSENKIITKQLSIATPRHELLFNNINEEFVHGHHYLIKGVSGIGKSTFVRALAGIWPYAMGDITLPSQQKMMYLPQKPYMPIGSLSEAILFPDQEHDVSEDELKTILRNCRLEALIPRLQETTSWSEQLSPGEQQRISFARVLLHKPDWVFLDESTSMLDLGNEEYLYRLLKSQLPHCSIVSVGHRPSLDSFHDHILNMARYIPAPLQNGLGKTS